MTRPRKEKTVAEDRTREAYERHLWTAVERGSVTAMKLWADLHKEDFQKGASGAGLFEVDDGGGERRGERP
jgi:hypothetical protein